MIEYPTSLPKPLISGHSQNPSSNFFRTEMDYASKHRAKYKGLYFLNLAFYVPIATSITWSNFFHNTLADGVKSFHAEWEVQGLTQLYEFRFTEAPKFKPTATGYNITVKAELLTDIYELMKFADMTALCPEVIECQNDILNTLNGG